MRADAVVVGGGPAGVAAAIALRQLRPQSRVLLLEARTRDEWRPGETLPPGCRPILESLGCWERFLAENFSAAHATRAAWGAEEPYSNDFLYTARGSGWHLDRARFDRMLRLCAEESGVSVLQGAWLVSARRAGEDWEIAVRRSEGRMELAAGFAIDATGRGASFARLQGARTVPDDRLVGVVGVLPWNGASLPALVEAQPGGWWYSTTIPESRLVVAWMSDSDLVRTQRMYDAERWSERLRESRLTAERVGGACVAGALSVFAAQSQRLNPAAGPAWAAAGDAASTCDPLASQGIMRALRTGKMAAFAAFDFLEGRVESVRKYDRLIAGEYSGYRESKAWYYGVEQRWPEAAFWRRRRRVRDAA